jgi:hypothetical protein
MVDSPKEETMDGASNLSERVQVIEQKLDTLGVSVDTRFAEVDRRFDGVGAAIAEQRAYTEYVYEKLDQKMDAGFAKVDAGFAKVDADFAKVDGRFARLERKIDQIIDLHAPRTPPNESEAG